MHPVQQHVVLPWAALLARACAVLVTQFDMNAAAIGKVLWNPATGFGVSIEPGCNGVEACIILFYLGQWKETEFKIAHEILWQGLITRDVLVRLPSRIAIAADIDAGDALAMA